MTAHDLAGSPEAPVPSSPSLRSPSSRSRAGALASRYRSLFVLGRGGMGSVEAALELEPPGSQPNHAPNGVHAYERIVALKRLLPDAAHDKRRVDMFLREARLAAMLDHPNVVRAYDYGEANDELYLAMEYVEGQPLSRVLRALSDANTRLPIAVVTWLLAEVCRGLHAAHELSDPTTAQPLHLVHRDVSPQNVMLGYDGSVRLLDFGVAKIETESVTRTGEVKGKTAYMSPEQAMGEPLDRRSDLFGVGAVLYEIIALRRMWGEGTDMEVIRKLALESPPSLMAIGVDMPAGLSELHARLVAREVESRPATALEVADALSAMVDDPDAAERELRSLLDTHFGAQAAEQRARLAAALHEVAPDQANELRESILPLRRSGELATVKEARLGARTVLSGAPSVPGQRRLLLAAAALASVAVIAWRLSPSTPPSTAPSAPSAVAPPLPIETASPSPLSAATPETTAPPTPAPPASSATVTGHRAPVAPARPSTSTPRPPVSARPTPPTATTKPPELDEKPF